MGYSRADSLSLLRARKASDINGFHQRRFDLLAIMRLVMQSWFGYFYRYFYCCSYAA
jgi:hypothetical protein